MYNSAQYYETVHWLMMNAVRCLARYVATNAVVHPALLFTATSFMTGFKFSHDMC